VLQLQEEEISTMGKISSQAETLVLTDDERNALPSQRCREWERMGKTKHLVSKTIDPDFHAFLYQESRAHHLCNFYFLISAYVLIKGMQRQERQEQKEHFCASESAPRLI